MRIDLNCDLGEGCAYDAVLLPLITSANVCCGFHAGDETTAWQTLDQAARLGVRVGAHPGFADREQFGRREIAMSEEQIFRLCVYQVGALQGLIGALHLNLAYIKPHGALYNLACREDAYARPVIEAASLLALPVLGLPGSRLQALARDRVRFVPEGFADRRYQPDGQLVPRTQANAFLENPEDALHQAEWLLRTRGIETLCVHGDNPQALDFVRRLRQGLQEQGIQIEAFA